MDFRRLGIAAGNSVGIETKRGADEVPGATAGDRHPKDKGCGWCAECLKCGAIELRHLWIGEDNLWHEKYDCLDDMMTLFTEEEEHIFRGIITVSTENLLKKMARQKRKYDEKARAGQVCTEPPQPAPQDQPRIVDNEVG